MKDNSGAALAPAEISPFRDTGQLTAVTNAEETPVMPFTDETLFVANRVLYRQ
jgi:hypothetical protein